MSWRATLLWSLLAALVGFGLFHVKYQVQALEDRLAKLNRDIVREQAQIHVLRAEWTYLNRPERIEELANKYLQLAAPKASQIGSIAELPMRRDGEEAPAVATRQPAKSLPAPAHRVPGTPVATPVAAVPSDAYALRPLMKDELSAGLPDDTVALPAGGR
ncbi:MAG: cell division protein FtsL [Gemmatimonas sp.]